jgi:voltage-gated potassium channel
MHLTIKKKKNIYQKIDIFIKKAFSDEGSRLYFWTTNFITFFVFVSVAVMIAESMYTDGNIPSFLIYLEFFILALFTIDYSLNIYASKPSKKYIFSFMGVIDLLAVLPSYLGMVNLSSIKIFQLTRILRFLRFMRLLRMLRILKLSKGIKKSLKNKSKNSNLDNFKISLQIYLMLFFFVLIFFSSLMYYVEGSVEGSSFRTIPDAMWWCIGIITSVGSDMQVQTFLGKIISAFTMISGLVLFGLLMNVIGRSLMVFLFGSSQVGRGDKNN